MCARFAGTMHFQMQAQALGSVLYSLSKLSKSKWMLLSSRVIGGLGGSFYPVNTFVAEHVGKKQRSKVTSWMVGTSRSLGLALGPVVAAVLVYVDFDIGELTIDRETNPGWTVAIACLVQTGFCESACDAIVCFVALMTDLLILTLFILTLLILSIALVSTVAWYFPRHGSRLMQKKAQGKLEERALPESEGGMRSEPWIPYLIHKGSLALVIFCTFANSALITGWEVSAMEVIQLHFSWVSASSRAFVHSSSTGPPAPHAPRSPN